MEQLQEELKELRETVQNLQETLSAKELYLQQFATRFSIEEKKRQDAEKAAAKTVRTNKLLIKEAKRFQDEKQRKKDAVLEVNVQLPGHWTQAPVVFLFCLVLFSPEFVFQISNACKPLSGRTIVSKFNFCVTCAGWWIGRVFLF